MRIYCTYCSAEKNSIAGNIPAIERYTDPRIKLVFDIAKRDGIKFMILSGRFGLLEANESIPRYDHLLEAEEVDGHARKIAEQLAALNASEVHFFTIGTEKDPKLINYHRCIEIACYLTRVTLHFLMFTLPDDKPTHGNSFKDLTFDC